MYSLTSSFICLFSRVIAEDDALFAAEESLLAMEIPLIPSEEQKARNAARKLKSMDPNDPSHALDHSNAIAKGQGILLAEMMSDDEDDLKGRGKGSGKASKDITKDHRVISALLDQEVEVSHLSLLDLLSAYPNTCSSLALSAHRSFYTILTQATHKKRS